jgi:hypothetical protein
MEPIVILSLTLLAILIHSLLMKKRTTKKVLEVTFLYFMVIQVGLGGIMAFIMHVFFGAKTAAMIGWAAGSPFQFEVGVADLAFGVTALLVPWIRGTYWLAAALANATFLLGCSIGHFMSVYQRGDTAVYNVGPVLFISDIFIPISILILAIILNKKK